ncbi:protein-tyrosine phosphatase family protein [Roseovarius sp. S4756]|uniref:protein-tyrosine phosphatase family protein n=1 Tax=Roseovarius maritimus TaxID=3342637 RepID=UPI0037298A35
MPDIEAAPNRNPAEPVALSALRGGGRVLFHCPGGCGRSGMAALRLMIAAAEAPDAAQERLRARRPCAVETSAQMRWPLRGQAVAGSSAYVAA